MRSNMGHGVIATRKTPPNDHPPILWVRFSLFALCIMEPFGVVHIGAYLWRSARARIRASLARSQSRTTLGHAGHDSIRFQ
ncbi:MAG: hypothetical protein ABF946_07355 [Acetobacter papayae]